MSPGPPHPSALRRLHRRLRIHLPQADLERHGGNKVGGFEQVLELAWTQIYVSVLALLAAMVVALPVASLLRPQGQRRTDRGRDRQRRPRGPELAAIALIATVIGVGVPTLTLARPARHPAISPHFVGIRQVDRRPSTPPAASA